VRLKFSTDRLPPEERFEAFRDHLARRLFQFDMISRHVEPYRGVVDLTMAGPVTFGQIHGSAADFVRTRKMARQCEEGVWLLLNRRGSFRVSQGDMRGEIASGDGFILDSVRGHEGACLIESDSWMIGIPEAALKGRRPKSASNRARLLHAVLEAHHRLDEIDFPEAEARLGEYLADLAVLAMGASQEGAHLAKGRGLKAARLQVLLDEIGRNFSHGGLSPGDIAERVGVSIRYVHRLLAETGASFSEHVLEKRLTHAYELLVSPARGSARIADIAFECGFSDLSFFNRSFRRRFGCTPSDARAQGIIMNGG
jgi:AraC-like DNA-binding protein